MTRTASSANLVIERVSPNDLLIRLSGNCRGQSEALSVKIVREALERAPPIKSVSFDCAAVTGWDSLFVAFIRNCAVFCRARNIELRDEGLPQGVRRLLRLASA